MKFRFYLRWSLRDARQRWIQVLAIALITALGTAVFSAFGNQREWRESSLDRSFEMLKMFDLRLAFTKGSYADQTDLETALASVAGVQTVETRLAVPTLLDASKDGQTILYPGEVIGVDVTDGGPHISRLHVLQGRGLTEADAGQSVVVIDSMFTKYRGLQPGDAAKIAGDISLEFVGRGQAPENIMMIPAEGGIAENENTFAVMYMPLDTIQTLSGHIGLVNEAVLLLTSAADVTTVKNQIETVMAAQFPELGFELIEKQDDPAYRTLYADARGDQRIWNIVGALFLVGAAMATFNLVGRIVEAQRRQIGIGMALGVPPRWLAFRPLLLGAQVALLGTLFGLIFGYLLTRVFADIMNEFMPLPYWGNPFYAESFLLAAALGVLVPVLATTYPVWRAVRVAPVDAIQTGYLVAKGGGLSPLMHYLPIPGQSFMQMPFRNVLRAPRRTLLTLLGVAIAILLLVAMSGLVDTIRHTIQQATDFYTGDYGDRVIVVLDTFYPTDSAHVATLTHLTDENGQPLFRHVDMGLVLVGDYVDGDHELMALIEMVDLQTAAWTPELQAGRLSDGGIVISHKAARDLGVGVGDTVTLSHPKREGLLAYRMVETELQVIGIHENPLRPQAYMSLDQADLMGVDGLTNTMTLYPTDGVNVDTIRRALFAQSGIASVQVVQEIPQGFEEVLELFAAVMVVTQGIVLVLAFLIAFNTTSINVDERVREIATMFAFGLPIRTVTRMQIMENLITGALGTVVGIGLGYLAVVGMVRGQMQEMVPDIEFIIELAPITLLASAALGVGVVALTPLLSIRRMLKMDIPATLRVME